MQAASARLFWTLASLLLIASLLPLAKFKTADSEGEDQVKDAAEALIPFFAEKPGKELGSFFSAEFLKNIDVKVLDSHFRTLYSRGGKAISVNVVKMTRPYGGEVEYVMQKQCRLPVTIQLEREAPHKIFTFFTHDFVKEDEKIADIQKDLKDLDGSLAYSLVKLGPAAPKVVWNQNGDLAMPVGSTFKLLILATLVDEINKGTRKWDDVVPVHKEWASLPAGLVQDWPDKFPVTLGTYATLMVSKSDNTAADHLIHTLGRERIEEMQRALGIKNPERNMPLLSTAEAMKIKLICSAEVQKQFAAAGVTERRQLLDSVIKNTPLKGARLPDQPVLTEKVDWYLSANDLCRIMDWLRKQEQTPYVKDILTIEEGLGLDKRYWSYIGYKGGAEPGVINFTMLLQNSKKDWFAFAITWHNPAQDVNMSKLITIAQRLLRTAQKQ